MVGAYKAFHKWFRIAVTIHKVRTYQITGDSTAKHFQVNNSYSINSTNYYVLLRGTPTQRFSSMVSDSMHVIIEFDINVLLNVIYSIVCEIDHVSYFSMMHRAEFPLTYLNHSIEYWRYVAEWWVYEMCPNCRPKPCMGNRNMWLYYQDQVTK